MKHIATIHDITNAVIEAIGGRLSETGALSPEFCDDLTLFDASALTGVLERNGAEAIRLSTRGQLMAFLERVLLSEEGRPAQVCRRLHRFLDTDAQKPKTGIEWRIGPTGHLPHIYPPSINRIGRALVCEDVALGPQIAFGLALDRNSARLREAIKQYVLFAQSGHDEGRRDFIIFARQLFPNAPDSSHDDGWVIPPTRLLHAPHLNRHTSFDLETALRSVDLMICIVCLDAEAGDDEDDSEARAEFALERLAGILTGRAEFAPGAHEEPVGDDGVPHDSWLGLDRCTDAFLGDGPRRRRLRASLAPFKVVIRKDEADPTGA